MNVYTPPGPKRSAGAPASGPRANPPVISFLVLLLFVTGALPLPLLSLSLPVAIASRHRAILRCESMAGSALLGDPPATPDDALIYKALVILNGLDQLTKIDPECRAGHLLSRRLQRKAVHHLPPARRRRLHRALAAPSQHRALAAPSQHHHVHHCGHRMAMVAPEHGFALHPRAAALLAAGARQRRPGHLPLSPFNNPAIRQSRPSHCDRFRPVHVSVVPDVSAAAVLGPTSAVHLPIYPAKCFCNLDDDRYNVFVPLPLPHPFNLLFLIFSREHRARHSLGLYRHQLLRPHHIPPLRHAADRQVHDLVPPAL
jgi:hypothetical protein